ncbi:MAG TPA: S46 family peptidase, partial [Saprospiraceae bacterium]|nr:S46 family peptidase [Saprospiraceae bacterium]
MKRIVFAVLLLLLVKIYSYADEGMWLPIFLKQLNEKEMRAAGMKLRAEDIYSINKGSLKDAVLHFGGGCTGEVVSPKGLLLTNHHCGYGQIQKHSTLEHNYIRDGFWAKNMSEELPCEGLTVTFISRIEDVSTQVLLGVNDKMTESERQSVIDQNIAKVSKSLVIQAYEAVSIKPFFTGNQYFAIISVTYKDVRMVGAPPESIGKYGSDTDNWVWPRHTGDFSVFRIYAGKNNLPADYSPDNVPYVPKHYFPISLDGVKENDFTMIFGFPGRTDEYLPGIGVQQATEVLNPVR